MRQLLQLPLQIASHLGSQARNSMELRRINIQRSAQYIPLTPQLTDSLTLHPGSGSCAVAEERTQGATLLHGERVSART